MSTISSQAPLSVADLRRLEAKPIQASQLPDNWAEHLKCIEESRDPELMAQRRAENLAKQNAVKAHTIFRKGGEVIAVLYENGSTTYPKGGDVANALGAMTAGGGKNLEGSALVDFMAEQMALTLQSRMGGVEVESFPGGNAPTQGEMDFRLFGSSGGASPVAPDTMAALLAETQETAEFPRDPYLWEIANNPAYAAEQSKIIGTSIDLPFFPTWDDVVAYMNDPSSPKYELGDPANPTIQTQKRRAALYDSLVEEGRSPEEIILEIYRFNASLPASYSDFLDPSGAYPGGYYLTQQREYLETLEGYLA